MDCYGYLTVCPSHLALTSAAVNYYGALLFFFTGFHYFSVYLIAISMAYQCFCHVHQAGG